MASCEMVGGQTVRIDLSGDSKPERDIVWFKMVAEFGHRNVQISTNGCELEVKLPLNPRLAEVRAMVETVLVPQQHRGA